jgi:hypothetical protein
MGLGRTYFHSAGFACSAPASRLVVESFFRVVEANGEWFPLPALVHDSRTGSSDYYSCGGPEHTMVVVDSKYTT